MTRCQGVFTTWDDEYDKFAGMLREMSKKKREETLKFSWRANPAHKKLQDRAVKMRQLVCMRGQHVCVCVCVFHYMYVLECPLAE